MQVGIVLENTIMADAFNLDLVSPEKLLVSRLVKSVQVPGLEGDFEVLPDHAPVLSTIRPGVLVITETSGAEKKFYVRGGFVEMSGENMSVLAEYAIPLEQLNPAKLEQEIRWAEEDLQDARNDEERRKLKERLDFLVSLRDALQQAA